MADAYDNSMAENPVSTLSKRELAHRHSWTTPQKSARVTIFSEYIEAFYNGLGEFEQSVGAATEALAEGVTEGTQGAKDGGGRFYEEALCPRIPGDYSLRLLYCLLAQLEHRLKTRQLSF